MAQRLLSAQGQRGCTPSRMASPASLSTSRTVGSRSRALRVNVRAIQNNGGGGGSAFDELRLGMKAMAAKYDFLSTSVGALSVTTYCVVYGHQEPMVAMQITVGSVLAGLVLNELLFSDRR